MDTADDIRNVRMSDGGLVTAWGKCITCPAVGGHCASGKESAFYAWNPAEGSPGFTDGNAEMVTLCGAGEGWWYWASQPA